MDAHFGKTLAEDGEGFNPCRHSLKLADVMTSEWRHFPFFFQVQWSDDRVMDAIVKSD